jgi:hypothetical protein
MFRPFDNRITRALWIVAVTAALTAGWGREARAACLAGNLKPTATSAAITLETASPGGERDDDEEQPVVGLWRVAFLAGDGVAVAYEGFQQWHAGGTETMVDNGVAPAFGNVCVGVWKQTGPRTFRLRHVTFNWDENGRSTGTFQLLMTVRLDRTGRTYAGVYTADSFDLAGNAIPSLHAEGRLRGVRISVE